jgi:hypothetical protein
MAGTAPAAAREVQKAMLGEVWMLIKIVRSVGARWMMVVRSPKASLSRMMKRRMSYNGWGLWCTVSSLLYTLIRAQSYLSIYGILS